MRNATDITSGYHINQHHIKDLLDVGAVREVINHCFVPQNGYVLRDYEGMKIIQIAVNDSAWPYTLHMEDGTEVPVRILILEVIKPEV